jgi:hypothetical protein
MGDSAILFLDSIGFTLIILLVNIPIYVFIGKFFYGDWYDFTEGLRYLFQPGWLSALRGEWDKDFTETVKLYAFIFVCFCVFWLEKQIVNAVFLK